MQVHRTGQPDQPVTKIFALQQEEDDENDDDAGRRERMNEQGDQGSPGFLQRSGIGLAYFPPERAPVVPGRAEVTIEI